MRLADKVAIVTGAGSGIDRAIAVRLASEGAKVAVFGQRLPRLQETAQLIASQGGAAEAISCDIADANPARMPYAQSSNASGALTGCYAAGPTSPWPLPWKGGGTPWRPHR